MAPVAQTAPVSNEIGSYDGSRPRFESLQAWLEIYGEAEYAVYKKDHAPSDLGYEEWATSVHAHGMYLWHAALDVWEEPSSSDEASGVEATATKLVLRGPPERKPKKPLTNGHGMRRTTTKTPKSTSREKSDEATESGKRRRKPKKKFLSQEIIALDDSDDIEDTTSVPEATNAEAPSPPPLNAASNGRRKSGGRRKKQFLSKETILSEDEDTDAMSIDAVAVAAADTVNALDALALEHHTPVPEVKAEPPKTKSGKKSRKKYLSQETITLDDDNDSVTPDRARSNTATVSPESAQSSANSRRGLRTRTAAQQRPYSQDARMFEEQLLVDPETEGVTRRSPQQKPTKLAQVSYPESDVDDMRESDLHLPPEGLTTTDDEDHSTTLQTGEQSHSGRKAHYKGKGRAWKKTSEDEDEDYKSPIKIKDAQPKRKLGRRKSAPVSETIVQDEEDDLEVVEEEPAVKEVVAKVKKDKKTRHSLPKAEKQKRKPRKSHTLLSEEFVRDDSDTEVGEQPQEEPPAKQKPQQILKLKFRKRTSDQSTSSSKGKDDVDEDVAFGTPSRTHSTPKSHAQKARLPVVSSNSSPEDRGADENGEMGHDVTLLSPLRKPRKRKSAGSDEGPD